jgi:hypothetical protein
MDPLAFATAWIADLHLIGCPVADATEREVHRVVRLAAEAGLPERATIALVRDILRRNLVQEPVARSVSLDLEGVRVVHVDGAGLGDRARP